MSFDKLARLAGGVAFREEDRGDEAVGGGGSGEDKEAEAAAVKAAEEAKAAEDAKTAADAARAAEKAAREKDVTIPKARFDEAVSKERAAREKAESELAELKKAGQSSADVQKIQGEIAELEEQLDKALADNLPAEKKRIRAEIRAREEALADAKAAPRAALATAQAVEQVRYDGVVDRAEAEYPFLVMGADDFDAELTESLLAMKRGGEADGLPSSEALKKALKALKPMLEQAKKARTKAEDTDDPAKKAAAEVAAAKAAEAAKTLAEAAEAKRREEAVAKGTAAAKAQPAPKPGAAGTVDKTVKDVKASTLSDKDFEKLPDEELKRLRGDSL